jgi:hypothetical protein
VTSLPSNIIALWVLQLMSRYVRLFLQEQTLHHIIRDTDRSQYAEIILKHEKRFRDSPDAVTVDELKVL